MKKISIFLFDDLLPSCSISSRVSEPACFEVAPAPGIFFLKPAPGPDKLENIFFIFLSCQRIV